MVEEAQARVDVLEYAYGFAIMKTVTAAIELGLPDVLENRGSPMTLSELSTAVDCPKTSLYRLMRFLTHRGIFRKETINDITHYAQTPLSRLLIREKVGIYVLAQAGLPDPYLLKKLRDEKGTGPNDVGPDGEKIWKYDNEYTRIFRECMMSHAKLTTSTVIDNSLGTFQGITSLVDVGGSRGTAVGMLVKAFPWIQGINFDLPGVVSVAPPVDGVKHVAGSMFESVPKADAVMLMWILHDWSDERCLTILKKCKEAIPSDTGKLIIVEAVIDEEGNDEYTRARLALDMTIMFATGNGKERTTKEWECLLTAAGFTKHTIKRMKAIECVIEAYP